MTPDQIIHVLYGILVLIVGAFAEYIRRDVDRRLEEGKNDHKACDEGLEDLRREMLEKLEDHESNDLKTHREENLITSAHGIEIARISATQLGVQDSFSEMRENQTEMMRDIKNILSKFIPRRERNEDH